MSTRGAIARVKGDGFVGVYHHWDSYPKWLGKTLWELYHGHFKGDLEAMLTVLIDQHPAGWSTINNKDFTKEPGFGAGEQPECYCHGDRQEEANPVTDKDAAGIGCEWVYVFNDQKQMLVLASVNGDGSKMIGMFGQGNPDAKWCIQAIIELDGEEPDWEAIKEVTYAKLGRKRPNSVRP